MKITIYFFLVIFCVFANISHSFADETITLKQELSQLKSQFQEMKHLYGQRIKSLETEIETINTQKLYRDDNAFLGQTNLPKSSLTAFNPEIGMIVDIVASSVENSNDVEGNDKISVRELELVIGHEVDPWTRLDTVITFSDFEDPTLEGAYITWTKIPHLKTRFGRMRTKLGKANALHRDQLETVDAPLVIQQYLGVEGYFKSGLELSGFLPFSTDTRTHELTVGVFEGGIGEEGELFGTSKRIPSYYAHLSNFFDLSESTSLEIGGTYTTGSRDGDNKLEAQAWSGDVTAIHQMNAINRLKLQAEAWWLDIEENPSNDDPWGLYALIDYRLSLLWDIGARYDWVEPVDLSSAVEPNKEAFSAYLTFHQSEFARWRVQYQHLEEIDDTSEDRVFLQGTFVMGVHKHQLQ